MKQTKSWLLYGATMIACLMCTATEVSAEDKFYLPDFEISAGETKELAIQFDCENANDYVAFQFDLYLPEGLTVEQKKGKYNFTFNTDRNDGHTFTSAGQTDGAIRVLAASLSNSCFWEESGDFVYFSVTASERFSGTHDIELTNIYFSTIQGERKTLSDTKTKVTVSGGNETVAISISAENKWSTCVLPFATELPTGVLAYGSESVSGEYLTLKEEASLKANTPYILFAENGYEGTLEGVKETATTNTVTQDLLTGALVNQEITSGYVLQNQGKGCMFYKVNGTITVPAGKCWLNLTGNRSAIRIHNGITGIEDVENTEKVGNIYTLDGKSVKKPQSGKVYIVNGKKVMKL